MSVKYSALELQYIEKVQSDIEQDLLSFFSDVVHLDVITTENKKVTSSYVKHSDRIFEWTTHPSQTLDTLVKQRRKEITAHFFKEYLRDKNNNFCLRSQQEWVGEYAQEQAKSRSSEIIKECIERLFSLSNAKISAHSGMTPDLLQKVPEFFAVYSRYQKLSGWQQEEKAEEKNISFKAFLAEENIPQVYIDERWESIQAAKKMFSVGEENFYIWIDFDGAKRPDGIMISIFAQMLIDEIDTLGQGISEQKFVHNNSLFTLSEREYNREIVRKFEAVDITIYALTRQMVSHTNFYQNPVCISQMELLKRDRELYLQKLMKIRTTVVERLHAIDPKEVVNSSSDRIHFIPRFDPFFVKVLRKSELGKNLAILTKDEMQAYNTVSIIIDQIIIINSLSQDRVCQIILAQAEAADDLIVIDDFLEEKIKRWRDRHSNYLAPNPVKDLSLCPLFESEYTATPEHVSSVLSDLWEKYGGNGKEEVFSNKFPEMFFAGSDLSKSVGPSTSYMNTWLCAGVVQVFNKQRNTDIVIKLGSGESYFRQNGFLDPKYKEVVWSNDSIDSSCKKGVQNREMIEKILERNVDEVVKSSSGLESLLKKSPWLSSITLQSKAREWIFEMPSSKLHNQLKAIYAIKKENKKVLLEGCVLPSDAIRDFCAGEKYCYQSFIGKEKDTSKAIDSYASLVELFATEMGPVLRDRALQRTSHGVSNKKKGEEVRKKIASASGINSRSIAANTASSFLFPLGILGKGSAFEKIEAKYSLEDIKLAVSYWETEELLQVIRQYSQIASQFFSALQAGGLIELSKNLEQEWNKIEKIIPVLIEIVSEKIFHKVLNHEEKAFLYPLLSDRYKALLDYNIAEKKWNFESNNLQFLKKNWNINAFAIVQKSAEFLSGKQKDFPFTQEDKEQWDKFITMSCRMRGDMGLLG